MKKVLKNFVLIAALISAVSFVSCGNPASSQPNNDSNSANGTESGDENGTNSSGNTDNSTDDENTYKIYFYSNDGTDTCSVQKVSFSSDSSLWYYLDANQFKREGYIFTGWSKDKDASEYTYEDKAYLNRLLFLQTDENGKQILVEPKLYAVWTDASKLYVRYMRNYSSDDTEMVEEVYDVTDNKAEYKLIECPFDPKSDSYVFAGWNYYIYPGETEKFESDSTRTVTYKALWLSKSDSFTRKITYYSDNKETESKEIYASRSSYIKILDYMFENTSETDEFYGWSNYSSYKNYDTYYLPGQGIKTSEIPYYLYPKYKKDITLTLYKNDGTSDSVQKVIKACAPTTVPAEDFTNGDKKFVCWGTSSSATAYSTGNIQSDQEYSFGKDTILYAIWSAPITITFDPNGGDGEAVEVETYQWQDTETPEFTRDGYTLLGFSQAKEGYVYYSTGTTSYSKAADVTLYAIWSKPVTVKLYAGYDFDPEYSEVTLDCNKMYYLPNTSFVANFGGDIFKSWERDVYVFKGWTVKRRNGSSQTLNCMTKDSTYAESVMIYEDTESLTALWQDPIRIIFNANNDTDEKKTQLFPYKKSYKLEANTFTYEGYTFAGWGEEATDTSIKYKDGGSYTFSQSRNLYAIWTKNEE